MAEESLHEQPDIFEVERILDARSQVSISTSLDHHLILFKARNNFYIELSLYMHRCSIKNTHKSMNLICINKSP